MGTKLVHMRNGARAGGMGSAVAMMVGSCVSLQFGAAVAVLIFPVVGTWAVTAARLAIAAGILLVIVRPRLRQWTTDQCKCVARLGFALAAMNGCFYAAIDRIPLGVAVSIEFMGPLILAAVLSRRRVDVGWACLAMAGMVLLGVESVMDATSVDPVGVLFAILAAGFWVFYILANARVAEHVPGSGGLAVALVVAALCVLPAGLMQGMEVLMEPRILVLAALVAVLSSAIPYSLELAALRRIPRNVFGVLLAFEPIFATLAGQFLLHQEAGVIRWAAVALVIVATIGTAVTAGRVGQCSVERTHSIDDGERRVASAL